MITFSHNKSGKVDFCREKIRLKCQILVVIMITLCDVFLNTFVSRGIQYNRSTESD